MDTPKFDGISARTIVHWLLAVKQCGVAQIIKDDTRMVSYAISHCGVRPRNEITQRIWPTAKRSIMGDL